MSVVNAFYTRWGRISKRCTFRRVVLFCLLIVPIYNELLSYTIQTWLWKSLYLKSSKDDQVRILLVADPQLQGFNDENPYLGFITRWDADRYLSKTFSLAYSFSKPEVVVFLGDLLDEGSGATDSDYAKYFFRFHKIFQTKALIQRVYLPGDNDAGGEGADLQEDWKIKRFLHHFSPDDKNVQSVKFLDFVKLFYTYGRGFDDKMQKEVKDILESSPANMKIILNHMPLMDRARQNFEPLVTGLKASMIFTAHTHKAKLYTCLDCHENKQSFRWKGGIKDIKDYSVVEMTVNNDITMSEITVPTCSYRMGVPRMGYGFAIIDRQGEMQYTVLWTPSRFRQLYSYLFFVIALLCTVLGRMLMLRWFAYKKINGLASR